MTKIYTLATFDKADNTLDVSVHLTYESVQDALLQLVEVFEVPNISSLPQAGIEWTAPNHEVDLPRTTLDQIFEQNQAILGVLQQVAAEVEEVDEDVPDTVVEDPRRPGRVGW